QKPIIKRANLSVKQGEILGLVGKSGAGKSSLLKIISGLIDPDEGDIFIDQQRMPRVHQLLIPGFKRVAMVNQDFQLDIYHTVEENLREVVLHLPNHKRDQRVQQLLRLFELKSIATSKAHLISGGEQQRLAIARAIADQPEILLLDEPFGHLDANLRARLTQHLLRLREEENTTIILVSHEGQDVLGLCDSICILKNGHLSKKFKPEFLYYHYSNVQQARLFGPVNVLHLAAETIMFRPDEYRISQEKNAIPVEFIRSIFVGGLYHNYFKSEKGDIIILYQFERLNDTRGIEIVKKTK
ncbi:MAG: ABC transporter ATP-binding protein, partial [Flavobacteriales bacterium]